MAGLGTVSAVIILVFKDTILGFVASIQVSVNDMVRIGDWITFQKYGADGDVIEILAWDDPICRKTHQAVIKYSHVECSSFK